MKPSKVSTENPFFTLSELFKNTPWELSGGTRQSMLVAFSMICAINGKTVVEIGVWQGFSSLILGRALAFNSPHENLLVSIDINQRALDKSLAMTKKLPVQHLTILGDSKSVDIQEILNGKRIDLAFIDGAHDYESCKSDLALCSKYLSRNGILLIHDYSRGSYPGVFNSVNEFVKDHGWPLFFLPQNDYSTDYRTAVIQNVCYR